MRLRAFLFAVLLASLTAVCANPPVSPADFDQLYPNLEKLYVDLHQAPELSLHEEKTSARLVSEIRALGYEVTPGVGGYGVVAILRNGTGPNVLLRTDTDALPVEEKTGLPFASRVYTAEGTPVMHACGHDLHMTAWIGTAKWMASHKQQWTTFVYVLSWYLKPASMACRALY